MQTATGHMRCHSAAGHAVPDTYACPRLRHRAARPADRGDDRPGVGGQPFGVGLPAGVVQRVPHGGGVPVHPGRQAGVAERGGEAVDAHPRRRLVQQRAGRVGGRSSRRRRYPGSWSMAR